MKKLLSRLVREESGQDLIEYALLAAFVAIASLAALQLLQTTLRDAYVRWDTDMQAIAEMPGPGS